MMIMLKACLYMFINGLSIKICNWNYACVVYLNVPNSETWEDNLTGDALRKSCSSILKAFHILFYLLRVCCVKKHPVCADRPLKAVQWKQIRQMANTM